MNMGVRERLDTTWDCIILISQLSNMDDILDKLDDVTKDRIIKLGIRAKNLMDDTRN